MNMNEIFRLIDEAFDKERTEQEQMIANEVKEEVKNELTKNKMFDTLISEVALEDFSLPQL